jgi:peptidoglycan/xylan/chitin deacetylase (PgdA/CDA1 family)
MSVVSVLGSRPVSALFAAATRQRARALAYHTVTDATAFAAQLDLFGSMGMVTVTGEQVARSLHGGRPLPRRALWITFDDGDASVAQVALPLLRERGMVATAFLCGAWIDTAEAPWWQVVEAATPTSALVPTRLALKAAPDGERRERVAAMADELAGAGTPVVGRQWSTDDVAAWLAAGNDIGNHSWDHPCLDRCDDSEQRRQVRLAHHRLSELTGTAPDVFAWPNGDPAAAALDEARALGYRLVAKCDHRLMRDSAGPFAVSRLKLDADVGVERARAVISGAHSTVFHLQQRLRGRRPTNDVT